MRRGCAEFCFVVAVGDDPNMSNDIFIVCEKSLIDWNASAIVTAIAPFKSEIQKFVVVVAIAMVLEISDRCVSKRDSQRNGIHT